jgi:hypothetical protein
MRASDLSPDCRKRLVPIPGHENVKALVPPSCPRRPDVRPMPDLLVAAERAIAGTAAVARLTSVQLKVLNRLSERQMPSK